MTKMNVDDSIKSINNQESTNFNETAENIIYNYLTNPNIAAIAERLSKIPMTCPYCHVKGLKPIGDPFIVKRSYGYGPVDVTIQHYICPSCGVKFEKFNHKTGGGIMRIR